MGVLPREGKRATMEGLLIGAVMGSLGQSPHGLKVDLDIRQADRYIYTLQSSQPTSIT